MPAYTAPLRDMQFVLFDLFGAERVWAQLPAFDQLSRDLAEAVLGEAARLMGEVIAPNSRAADEFGVVWRDGEVTTAPGYREAWRALAQGGWQGLSGNTDFGGQNMPKLLALMVEEMLCAADVAFSLYPVLSSGAALLLEAHASAEQKAQYLPPLYRGDWAGVMCLTESHAGSDLGIIRTRAEPQADGSYHISGTKIFITGGEHDLTDNIVHLVLARLPDAPAGTKGISLFVVPKVLPDTHGLFGADGTPGGRNAVRCSAVEHKMGIHASSTCVLNYDGATGWLIGDLGRGLNYMFTMMNYERLTVGVQGLGAGERSFQGALAYARERLQGRAAGGAINSTGPADPIIAHADVRRMLLNQKVITEGGRALAAYVGLQLDLAKYGAGAEQQLAEQRVALLTPIAKAFLTDQGFDCCVLGQQIFGGHGYIRESGMEQLVRDARITQIYEGTNGIQALDLLGRKVVANGGKTVWPLLAEMRACAAGSREFAAPLGAAIDDLETITHWLIERAATDAHAVNAAAVDYLNHFGLTLSAWLWARAAAVAAAQADAADGFYRAKIQAAQFFFARCLPRIYVHSAAIRAGSAGLMALAVDEFAY
ncbi:MAG: acyl-CoA dehydrogenase C-terminal domain-containing protein [Spongiibacteraceae bacterium]